MLVRCKSYQSSPNYASVNTYMLPLWRLAYRLGGVFRECISLATDRRDDTGGRGREMEEEGDLDD